jgi:hypothetical protein
MFLAGQAALRQHVIIHSVLFFATIILVSVGGAAVLFGIGVLMTGQAEPVIHYVWIGAFAAGAFFLFAQRWSPARLARVTTSSTYGRGPQWAHFDKKAAIFGNAHAEWRTDWSAIDTISLGKKGIVVRVATIAFVIPRSAVDDAVGLVKQLESWKETA